MRSSPGESGSVPAWLMRTALLLILRALPGCGDSRPHVKWDYSNADGGQPQTSTCMAECLRLSGRELLECDYALDPVTGAQIPINKEATRGEGWCKPARKADCDPPKSGVPDRYPLLFDPKPDAGTSVTTCHALCTFQGLQCDHGVDSRGNPLGPTDQMKKGDTAICVKPYNSGQKPCQ